MQRLKLDHRRVVLCHSDIARRANLRLCIGSRVWLQVGLKLKLHNHLKPFSSREHVRVGDDVRLAGQQSLPH